MLGVEKGMGATRQQHPSLGVEEEWGHLPREERATDSRGW